MLMSGGFPSRCVSRAFHSEMRSAGSGPLEASWGRFPESVDLTVSKFWHVLVARSRSALNDDGFFSNFIGLAKNNVVGHLGIHVEAAPVGRGDKVDQVAKGIIDDAWDDFSEQGVFDVTGQLSRKAFEELWVSTKMTDGEAIARVVVDDCLPWGFGVQMIDPMRLDVHFNEDFRDGRFIRHGIEFDYYGRPVAYYFNEDTAGRSFGYSGVRGERKRVSAEFVIHDFIHEFVGQKRGLPQLRSILWRLRQFSRAEDSMISNLRASASKMGFFSTDGSDEEPPGAGEEGKSGVPIEIDNADAEFYDIGNKRMIPYSPAFPDAAVEPFMRTLARGISSGMGANYYKVFNDLTGVSFSSIRQGELSERDFWRSHQVAMIDGLVKPLRKAWLKYSLLSGRLYNRRRTLRPVDLQALRFASFKGRSWSWIDPQSEAAATSLMLERNMTSLTEVLSNQGVDFWEFIETLANERAEMEKRGIAQVVTPGGGVLASPGKQVKQEGSANPANLKK